MYAYGMHNRILRDPGAEGGGGAPAGGAAGGSAGAAAGAQGGAAGGSSGASAPEYVSRQDFESFSQRIEQSLSSFSRPEPKRDEGKSGEPKFPELADYDFKKPGEVQRYEMDKRAYFRHLDKQEDAKEREKAEGEGRRKDAMMSHFQRMRDYEKQNPGAAEALRKAGATQVLNEVKEAIYASKSSAEIVHYLAQNKDVAAELNELAETDGLDAVRFRLGEVAATIRAEQKAAKAAEEAAKDRPPRQNFRGNTGTSKANKSHEERFSRFHTAG